MKLFCAVALLGHLLAIKAFPVRSMVLGGRAGAIRSMFTRVSLSEPSDTSSDYVTVIGEAYEPSKEEQLVSNVINLMPQNLAASSISPESRKAINEAIFKLESVNPTAEPTLSPLLNGVWELRYWGGYDDNWALPSPTRQLALFVYSGGYSPGIFALFLLQNLPLPADLLDVGDPEVSISRDQPRVEAKVPIKVGLGGVDASISVKARLEVETTRRLKETCERAAVMDQNTNLPSLFQYSRDIYVTYLDDDLLIVRDGSGIPEILVRKQARFSKEWGNEPSSLDDMNPPGEGVEFGAPTM
jgi:PAP_fibrillin